MNIDIERIKQEIPIEELIGQSLTVTGRGHTLTTAEHDSLKIFTNNNTWTWYSQGGSNGRHLGGSTIDWYKHVNRCSTAEAIKDLGAMLDGGTIPAMPRPRIEQPVQPEGWKSPQWQQRAVKELEAAQLALMDDSDATGALGRAYLAERGIRPDMAVAFGLGCAETWNKKAGKKLPAIWIPWMNRQITAIQYRFIGVGKDDDTADRFGQLTGGKRYLFGLQHCMDAEPGQLDTLILVEGELNAVAIFQSIYGLYACDVVSYGPQHNLNNAEVAKAARALANRYRRVIVWADEPQAALAALGTIPNAIPIKSLVINGKQMDANDLLLAGKLDATLFGLLRRVKQSQVPETITPLTLVGQIVTAQQFYDWQQQTRGTGWILHGTRHGAVVDGYCDTWKITRAVMG